MTTYNYTTAELVKNELRATQDFSITTVPTLVSVTNWIQEESANINNNAGQIFGESTYSETFDYNGADVLLVTHAPIMSVTSILYSTTALGTTTYDLSDTKTEDTDYTVYKDSGEIEFLPSWSPSSGKKRIQINYTAGHATTPLNIQSLATKKVTKRIIDTLLSKDINEKQSGKSISVGSISIVKPADFGVSQYKVLKDDITRLEEEVIGGTSLYRLPLNRY